MSLSIALIFLILSFLLLYNNWKKLPNAIYLSLSLLVMGLIFIAQYIIIFDDSVFRLALIFNHLAPTYFLLSPFIFFYVRSTLTDKHALSKWDYLHFLPSIILLIAIMPYALRDWNYKMEIAAALRNDFRNIIKLPDLVLYPTEVNIIGRPLSVICYTVASLFLLFRFTQKYPKGKSIPLMHAQKVIRFLFLFVIMTMLGAFSFSVLSYEYLTNEAFSVRDWQQSSFMQLFETLALGTHMVLLFFPEILYGIPQMANTEAPSTMARTTAEKTANDGAAPFGDDQAAQARFQELATRITDYIENQKPYLNHDFSMYDLAKALDVPKHHLYYCFNSILNKRFTQLRSEYRVRHVCHLIEKGEARSKTLEAIGLESGFSSRSSFLTTFKELMGMSPGDYQQQIDV